MKDGTQELLWYIAVTNKRDNTTRVVIGMHTDPSTINDGRNVLVVTCAIRVNLRVQRKCQETSQ